MTPLNAQTTADSSHLATAVRLNAETVVCEACGCRLTRRESVDDAGLSPRSWHHFSGQPGRDARGCSVACVEAAHALS